MTSATIRNWSPGEASARSAPGRRNVECGQYRVEIADHGKREEPLKDQKLHEGSWRVEEAVAPPNFWPVVRQWRDAREFRRRLLARDRNRLPGR